MTATIVRAVTMSDLPHLIRLCAEHAGYERAAIEPPTISGLRAALFDSPVRLYAWVAECGEELVGYATATVEFSTWSAREFLHMDCLYVRQTYRGHGIGSPLIGAVIAHAAAFGMHEMQWQTPDWNVDAQRFYERLGASPANKVRFTLKVEGVRG